MMHHVRFRVFHTNRFITKLLIALFELSNTDAAFGKTLIFTFDELS